MNYYDWNTDQNKRFLSSDLMSTIYLFSSKLVSSQRSEMSLTLSIHSESQVPYSKRCYIASEHRNEQISLKNNAFFFICLYIASGPSQFPGGRMSNIKRMTWKGKWNMYMTRWRVSWFVKYDLNTNTSSPKN